MIYSYVASDFECDLNCKWQTGCMMSVSFKEKIRGKFEPSLRNLNANAKGDKPWKMKESMCKNFESDIDNH